MAVRVLVPAVALQFAFGLVFAWGAVTPHVRAEHWPPLLAGAVFSGTPLGYGFGMVIGGRLADAQPPRRLCWLSLALLGAGFLVAFSFPTGATFVIFYSILGLGLGGGVGLAGSVAAASQVLPRRIGTVGGLMTGAYAAIALAQVPVVSSLAASFGWIFALRVVGTAGAAVAAAALLLMPSLPKPAGAHEERATLRDLLRRPRTWTGVVLEMCSAPVGALAFVTLAPYALQHGLGGAAGTVAVAVAAAGNTAGRVGAGAAADVAGGDRIVVAILCCAALAAGALALLPASAPLLFAGAAAAGLSLGGAAGVMTRLGAAAAPDAPNSAFGLHFAGYAAGAFSGPLVGAVAGGGDAVWLVVGAPAVSGLAVVALRVRMTRAG